MNVSWFTFSSAKQKILCVDMENECDEKMIGVRSNTTVMDYGHSGLCLISFNGHLDKCIETDGTRQ